jgi:serine phosphatase RsbU (regulator of sigma subunit)
MQSGISTQRDTYKLLEKLASKNFRTELNLLKSLVHDIVEHPDFEIVGGRVWELDPENESYVLRYQYGKVKRIPAGYSIKIDEQPVVNELIDNRIHLNYETDKVLQKKGIILYSVCGVGDIVKLKSGKYYKYVLGYNAPEIIQSVFDTLNIISSVVTVALRDLTAQEEKKKYRRDVMKASEIQKNLLPEHHVRFHDYDIYGVCIPDRDVGGDYFDFIKNTKDEEDSLGIVISDAVSKGLPAAIQALFVSGAIRMGVSFATKISNLLAQLNKLIYKTFPYERFVTLFYCELTLSSNRLVLYANAGHNEPIHFRPETGNFQLLEPTGGFLGLIEEQKFTVENIRMHPGDVMVLYTDGITEAHNSENKIYGEERLMKLIKKHHKLTAQEINLKIISDVQKFTVNSTYTDDKTLVVIKRDVE